MKNILSAFSVILLLSLGSCTPQGPGEGSGPYLDLSTYSLQFPTGGGEETVTVETDLPKIAATSDSKEWCTVTLTGNTITVKVEVNNELIQRRAAVTVKGEGVTQRIDITQSGVPTDAIAEDVKITVASGRADYFYPGQEIEKSFDGNFQTYFISNWGSGTDTRFPFNVEYNFTGVPSMDYFIYYPKGGTTNGLLQRLEVWYAANGNTTLTKYGDFDFKGEPVSKKVEFSPALTNPTQIRIVLYEGLNSKSDGSATYAGIGEVEFYRKSDDSFDATSIFTDDSCSELKPGVTEAQIDAIDNAFFKYMATSIYNGEYDTNRVGVYKPWQNPAIQAAINKTGRYSQLDNPTGMYVEAGEELIVLAAYEGNVSVGLQSIDLMTGKAGTKSNYVLSRGVNKFTAASKGLVYVMYHTDTAAEAPAKVNFVTGRINGYFDKAKHDDDDWARLLNNAVAPHLDVVGEYAHLTFPVGNLKNKTPRNGTTLIQKYDDLVYAEMDFLGLVKYDTPATPRLFRNRMYFHSDHDPEASWMYATDYRTAYSSGTWDLVCDFGNPSINVWGPAHEVGHVNQTRPGLKWHGMTEVTTNIFSLYVQTVVFGRTSRLVADNRYASFVTSPGANTIFGSGKAFAEGDIWEQLIMFWQLKLYLMDALGKEDFYKDLFEHYRVTPTLSNAVTDGVYQLDFARQACRVANLDLTAFFEKWGFFKAVDLSLDDYGRFTITQSQVDALKAEIAAANYPQPAHNNIYMITDLNAGDYD